MGDTPTTVNTTANIVDGIIKAAIAGGDDAVEAYLIIQFPFLGWPIISLIFKAIVSGIGSSIQTNITGIANVLVIDIQTQGEQSSVVQAANQLSKAQAGSDPVATQAATDALITAYGNLFHNDGVASS